MKKYMGNLDKNIFGKKKFSDILKEIYDNSKEKEKTNLYFNIRIKTFNKRYWRCYTYCSPY